MKKFNPSTLPYIGGLASAVLMTYAGVECWGAWGWLIGPGVGITASLSVATASSSIGSITAKGRRTLAYLMLGGMLCLGPATIALSLYNPNSAWTAIAWGGVVDVSIVLAGAISGKGLVKQEETPQVASKSTRKAGKVQKVAPQVARKPVKDDELLAYLASNPGESQQQVADHFKVSRQAIGQRVKKLYEVKQ
jgi:hypothetical protein